MLLSGSTGTEDALYAVGEILQAEGERAAIVVVGGAALNLLGIVDRATRDVDILAIGHPADAARPELLDPSNRIPASLERAIQLVAADTGLNPKWMNTGPSLQWRQGLPPGLSERVKWRSYANLSVGLASRIDLVFLKLYAAADQSPTSVHYQDLLALEPTDDELNAASSWVKQQDPTPGFHQIVNEVVHRVREDATSRRE